MTAASESVGTSQLPVDLGPAAHQLALLVAGVGDRLLPEPSPCTEYTLGDLVDHVSGFSRGFSAAATKDLGPVTAAAPSADAGRLGPGWRTRIAREVRALAEAWADPASWQGTTQVGGVELTAAQAGLFALNELVLHGWDVARASGQEFGCDPTTLQACWDFAVATTPATPAPGTAPPATTKPGADGATEPAGPFGVPVEVPEDAPLIDRLVALRGRDPSWTAHPSADGVRAAYDAVATGYADAIADELDHKPLDRRLLETLLDLCPTGRVADVGCGPGHVTRFLADRHDDVLGIDLSPGMITLAREREPDLELEVGSLLRLPAADAAWAGAVALYSIIHLTSDERAEAFRELARAVKPDGWVLIAFHVDSREFAMGEVHQLVSWFGVSVELDVSFLDPEHVARDLEDAGLAVKARIVRLPTPGIEYPSRRCYLLAQRSG